MKPPEVSEYALIHALVATGLVESSDGHSGRGLAPKRRDSVCRGGKLCNDAPRGDRIAVTSALLHGCALGLTGRVGPSEVSECALSHALVATGLVESPDGHGGRGLAPKRRDSVCRGGKRSLDA